jgi:CheY-like chemotaxis protein
MISSNAADCALVRVLVADDDPILREFAASHLASPEIEVLTAGDGAEALGRLKAQAFDIALVDLDMPVMSGFELIAAIRADVSLQHLPVIVITGREDMIAIDEAFAAGANSFVVKPLNWTLLSHQIAYVLRNARTEQKLRVARDAMAAVDAHKTNMLRLMRHEFNTPLNAIAGFSRLIAQAAPDPSIRDMASDVFSAAGDLKRLSDDLFVAAVALSGEIRPAPSCFTMGELIASVGAGVCEETHQPQDRLRDVDRTNGAFIGTDFDSLKLIVRHLVRNALSHGCPKAASDPVLLVATVQDETGTLVVSVIDSGPGMDEPLMASARRAFAQADGALTRSSGGLGLGLAVVDAHVAALGGKLHLGPRDGKSGLIASVVLPGVVTAQAHADPALQQVTIAA